VELSYRCGWDNSKHLAHLLDERLPNHRKMKTTTDGPHRADIHLTTDNIPISALLADLFQIKSQVYITGIDLSTLQHQSHAMFHMEHGIVKKGL